MVFSVIQHISDAKLVNKFPGRVSYWEHNIWAATLQQNRPSSLQELSMHIKTPNISLLNLLKEAIRDP